MPPFACISYVWASDRTPNPIFEGKVMSANTVTALVCAAKVASPSVKAFCVDALCIPYTQPARNNTLESMGYIYSVAVEVIVALTAVAQRH